MPRWDLQCAGCLKTYEVTFTSAQERDEAVPHIVCDDCLLHLSVLPSSGSFVLKGAGFHQNDYPKKGR